MDGSDHPSDVLAAFEHSDFLSLFVDERSPRAGLDRVATGKEEKYKKFCSARFALSVWGERACRRQLTSPAMSIVSNGGAPLAPAVLQADVDLWDGRTVTLLRRIIGLYEAAHGVDPTVPRLVPIALRTLLVPAKRKASEPETPVEPAPPGGGT